MNDRENTLIRRTSIMANESLPSLLRRLADLNCYDPYSTLTQLIKERSHCKDKIELPRQAVTYREITALTRIPISEIHTSSAHFFAEVLTPPDSAIDCLNIDNRAFPLLSQAYAAKQLRPLHASQFCPKCLKESAHHRLIWMPIAVSACLQHGCLLVNHCPTCQSNITIQSIVEAQCSKCYTHLSLAESVVLYGDEWGVFSQYLIQAWLTQKAVTHPAIAPLLEKTSRILYRVVDGLQWTARILARTNWPYLHYSTKMSQLNKKQFQHKAVGSTTPYESYCLYATACKAIVNWPNGFYDFLEAYSAQIKKTAPSGGGPKADLGNLYVQWLQEYWQHPAFRFVHKAFEDYFIHHYTLSSAVIRTNVCRRDASIPEQFEHISIAEAARLLGTTPSVNGQ